MEVFVLWVLREKDVINFVEYICGVMVCYICYKFVNGGELWVVMVFVEVEDVICKGIC